jgi:hypothetical protein
MGITFRDDSSLGPGSFTRVLRDGRDFGFIVHADGVYRFYAADLESTNPEHLKAKIQEAYSRER